MKIGNKEFDIQNKTYIMGILNCTPDSFSDGGRYVSIDKALKQAEKLIQDGADIIDVGGESTRPGYIKISDDEEIERIVPVIERINNEFDTVISVDTYKSKVAESAIKAGVTLVNDIWGCKYDENMAKVIAKEKVACCLMHNRDLQKKPYKEDVVKEVLNDIRESIDIALKAGVDKDKIITDPGIGFAKSLEENLYVMNNVEKLHSLGYPILLGTSRKSMIGLTLDVPVEERLEGTLATTVMGVMKGCAFIRVHDVLENKRAALMTRAIIEEGRTNIYG